MPWRFHIKSPPPHTHTPVSPIFYFSTHLRSILSKKKKKFCTYLQNKKRLPAKIAPECRSHQEPECCMWRKSALTAAPAPAAHHLSSFFPPFCRCSWTSHKIVMRARLLQMQAMHSSTKVMVVSWEADLSREFRFHLDVCVCVTVLGTYWIPKSAFYL